MQGSSTSPDPGLVQRASIVVGWGWIALVGATLATVDAEQSR